MIACLLAVALSVTVSPRVAFAPATVLVTVTYDAGAGDGSGPRALRVTLLSEDFAQATERPIDGTGKQTRAVAPFRHVPAGVYRVEAVLLDAGARVTAIATTTLQLVPGGQP